MGLGTLKLYADTDADPRELLAPFASDDTFYLEVLDSSEGQWPELGLWGYLCEMDCSLTVYCSWCGEMMCPGCGDRPTITIFDDEAVAYCRKCARTMDPLRPEAAWQPRSSP